MTALLPSVVSLCPTPDAQGRLFIRKKFRAEGPVCVTLDHAVDDLFQLYKRVNQPEPQVVIDFVPYYKWVEEHPEVGYAWADYPHPSKFHTYGAICSNCIDLEQS